jgi:molecular chaperone GrpE (heat shock protein)
MDIILQGQHNSDEAVESLERVLQLFKERYQINDYREIHLTVTLVDDQGDEVELVDSDTNQPYRIFEVYRKGYELSGRKGIPLLQLVVDNTKN